MKIIGAITICLSLFTASVAVFAVDSGRSVQVLSMKEKNLFGFKADKVWMRAQVEILAVNGDCIMCQTLTKHKMMINFRDVRPGTYTIRVSKGERTEEFQYTKN
ncbi:MAG: hypothetical protein JST69_07465 [Bacteroidetes bacterium]|nr:hypothetical protein [Bacteroidota bacterium]